MLEQILSYERSAFFMLNGSNSTYMDNLMWLYSGKLVWLPLAVFILFMLVYKRNWKETVFVLLALILVITLCDQFASHLCKPLFTRFRPTHHPDFMNEVKTVFDYRGGKYGFMSSHAANAFGFATLMSLLLKYKPFTYTIFGWSVVTAYSRIYLGVHFISDVVPGALVGIFWGFIVYKLYQYAWKKIFSQNKTIVYPENRSRWIMYAIITSVLILILFSNQLITLIK